MGAFGRTAVLSGAELVTSPTTQVETERAQRAGSSGAAAEEVVGTFREAGGDNAQEMAKYSSTLLQSTSICFPAEVSSAGLHSGPKASSHRN